MVRWTRRRVLGALAGGVASVVGARFARAAAGDAELVRQAREAIGRAAGFFRSLAVRGGYVWWYSEDLRERAGENKVSESQVWVQPPGTPAVGRAMLRCFEATGDGAHLEVARAAADALAYGQLESGGWHYMVDFDAGADRSQRRAIAGTLPAAQRARRRNVTTFDDDTTQSVVRFLLATTRAKGPADEAGRAARLAEALEYALAGMLRAQYPNGAFLQAYTGGERRAGDFPVMKAKLPKDWRALPKVKDYWFHYTLNDQTHSDCMKTLLEAHRATGEAKYLDAAKRAGDFLLLAQLPEPQAAWAQQYTPDMVPAWARKFEPPAVCSVESVGAVRTLVDLYLACGDERYLGPIPAALAWLEKVKLADGRHARFYELGTDRPLYMTREYEVTYRDDDLPTHYGFQVSVPLKAVGEYYRAVKSAGREGYLARQRERGRVDEGRVREVLRGLDGRGRWVSAKTGRIESREFVGNVGVLCDYLDAVGRERKG